MARLNKKVLVVGTYPIKNPRHGGQKRLDAIMSEYKKNFSSALYTSVFFEGFYSDYSKHDIPLGGEGIMAIERSPLTGDIICGEAIYTDRAVKAKIKKLLITYNPDIVHIEQPFPYLGLKPLLKETGLAPKIVFGSQNIEGPMKREILESYDIPEDDIKKAEQLINTIEAELSKSADLVIACTTSDLEAHQAMGAKRLILGPNGVDRFITTKKALRHWENIYERMGVNRTAIFVSSAHPPSWTGFMKMVGKALGFVPNDSRIVAAGSVCDFFVSEIKEGSLDIRDTTFWLRAYAAGRLSEEKLKAIIAKSDVVLLPITEGGGSNLKTAEAIIADKKVVATSHSLRSFEWYRDFPNLWVADTPEKFQQAIVEALGAEKHERTDEQKKTAQRVLWPHCLRDAINEVATL